MIVNDLGQIVYQLHNYRENNYPKKYHFTSFEDEQLHKKIEGMWQHIIDLDIMQSDLHHNLLWDEEYALQDNPKKDEVIKERTDLFGLMGKLISTLLILMDEEDLNLAIIDCKNNKMRKIK